MKKIIRLTESDLHNLIQRSVNKILREQDESLLLQSIAQTILKQRRLESLLGENDAEFALGNDKYAYVTYETFCNPYMRKGMKSSSYDVPDDYDEIIADDVTVEVNSIEYCDNEGECIQIRDNGIVKKALEKVVDINFDGIDIPSEEEYFSEY